MQNAVSIWPNTKCHRLCIPFIAKHSWTTGLRAFAGGIMDFEIFPPIPAVY
jgi:hypothetical protein